MYRWSTFNDGQIIDIYWQIHVFSLYAVSTERIDNELTEYTTYIKRKKTKTTVFKKKKKRCIFSQCTLL